MTTRARALPRRGVSARRPLPGYLSVPVSRVPGLGAGVGSCICGAGLQASLSDSTPAGSGDRTLSIRSGVCTPMPQHTPLTPLTGTTQQGSLLADDHGGAGTSAPQRGHLDLVPCPYQRFFSCFDKIIPYAFGICLPLSLLGAPLLCARRDHIYWGGDLEGRPPNDTDSLVTIWAVVWAIAMVLQVFSGREYKNKAVAALQSLGFNSIHIAHAEVQHLRMGARVLCGSVPAFLFIAVRLLLWAATDDESDVIIKGWQVVSGLYVLTGGWVVCVLVFSMLIGAALANQPILELIQLVETTDPGDHAWTNVEQRAVKLADETMPAVSNGWGTMSTILIVTYWLVGFGEFICWLSFGTWFYAIMTVMLFSFSLLIFWPLAITSRNCDQLMVALNKSRLKYVGNRDAHHKILEVEIALRRLNLNQGLGYVIAGTVIDTRKIKQLFFAVVSTLSPVLATVMALRPNPGEAAGGKCVLDKAQALAFQTTAATFNPGCVYNLTIGSNGVVQW